MFLGIDDEDDFLHGSPVGKFFDIVFTANNDVVRHELEKIVEAYVAMDILLTEQFGDEVAQKVQEVIFSNPEFQDLKTSFFMEKMSAIVSQSE
jgi:hypothetical protein